MRKIAIIGSGAREHAIALRCHEEHPKAEIVCLPGNGGMLAIPNAVCISYKLTNCIETYQFIKRQKFDLAIVGPEAPLIVDRIADICAEAGVPVLGPSAEAALRTEGSKRRFKAILTKYALPTAPHKIFRHYELLEAMDHVTECGGAEHIVLKADGLCGGKGVLLPNTIEDAAASFVELRKSYKDNADFILVEKRLQGEEFSAIGITDGSTVYPFVFTEDYKRVGDGDRGLNTGGMGAHTTHFPPQVEAAATDLLNQVVLALRKEGYLYQGLIYLGLMRTEDDKLMILECNCRGGDPELQVILAATGGSFTELSLAAAMGDLKNLKAPEQEREALSVVLASPEYPDPSSIDEIIDGFGVAEAHGAQILHGSTRWEGTKICGGHFTTNKGGRILQSLGRGATLKEARKIAYAGAEAMTWGAKQPFKYRHDIGKSLLLPVYA